MRKTILSVAIVCLLGSTMFTTPSCIGSFSLSNRLLGWNNTLGNKFLNELVFFAFWVLPVYEVCGLADLLVLNSIEFWSGSNPMASGKKVIDGQDGRYMVECDGKGYTITSENDGASVRLDFDADTRTWSIPMPDGEAIDFLTFVDDTHVALPCADGSMSIYDLNDETSLMAYRQMADATLWAAR